MYVNQGGLKFMTNQIFVITDDRKKYIVCVDDQKNARVKDFTNIQHIQKKEKRTLS